MLAAGVFVALAMRSRARPADVARSIVVVAGAFAYIVFWSHFSQNIDSYRAARIQWRLVPPEQAALAGVPPEPGLQAGFAEWIKQRLRPGERFYLVPSATRDEAVYQWFTYRLLPNLTTDDPKQADWLVFYGTFPRQSGLSHLVKGIAERYGPGYSIARTQRAG